MARLKAVRMRKKLLYEVGVAIVMLTVLLGVLSTVTRSTTVVLFDTESLFNGTTITFELRNTTDPRSGGIYSTVNLPDIATIYNDTWYITVPYQSGYGVLRAVSFHFNNITWRYLVEHGINRVCVLVEPVNTTPITSTGTSGISVLKLTGNDNTGDIAGWAGDTAIIVLDGSTSSPWTTKCVDVDVGSVLALVL